MKKDAIYKRVKFLMVGLTISLFLITIFTNDRFKTTKVVKADNSTVPYTNFEGPQVHPICLTSDGSQLLAVNTPYNHLSVFQIATDGHLTLQKEIPVGLEPVSVAVRNNQEAWVTNWASDSVSIIDLQTGNVKKTLLVGDEPTDILFTGNPANGTEQAFVCVAGLNRVNLYKLSDPSLTPEFINIAGKEPRALSKDAEGKKVFVSIFESGNNTTAIFNAEVLKAGGVPAIPQRYPDPTIVPNPATMASAPNNGLILYFDKKSGAWVDDSYVYGNPDNKDWGRLVPSLKSVKFTDFDVAIINTANPTNTPQYIPTIGTHISNTAYNSQTDKLYVANTESTNLVRFEPVVKGRFMLNRVAVVSNTSTANPVVQSTELNPFINYNNAPGTDQERQQSLSLPSDIILDDQGTAYVTAMGSAKVAQLDSSGNVITRFEVGRGPTGLAFNKANRNLYVLNRIDNSVTTIDLNTQRVGSSIPVGYDPEPLDVKEGRNIFYDASRSAHGTVSCASCHRNGDRDNLSWDLGDPTADATNFPKGMTVVPQTGRKITSVFHPMKGPFNTQTLRGLAATGNSLLKGYSLVTGPVLHWRGDRPNSNSGTEFPLIDPLHQMDAFNGAFQSLLGDKDKLNEVELQQFNAFIASLTYTPNPNEKLDRTYADPVSGPSALRGYNTFLNGMAKIGTKSNQVMMKCTSCHAIDNFGTGTNGLINPPSDPKLTNPGGLNTQAKKVPQLRNLYKKTGLAKSPFGNNVGSSLSGFGYGSEGASSLTELINSPAFVFSTQQRNDVMQFLLSLDTGTAPAVGFQITVNHSNRMDAITWSLINLLMQQAELNNCDLVVNGLYQGNLAQFFYLGNNRFQNMQNGQTVAVTTLLDAADTNAELTFTGVPLGKGSL